jgi:hypothetical protein
LRELVVNYNRLGNVQAGSGDLLQAESTFRTMLELAERVHHADPSNMEWQHDLSVACYRLGDVRLLRGDAAEALRLHSEALKLRDGWRSGIPTIKIGKPQSIFPAVALRS